MPTLLLHSVSHSTWRLPPAHLVQGGRKLKGVSPLHGEHLDRLFSSPYQGLQSLGVPLFQGPRFRSYRFGEAGDHLRIHLHLSWRAFPSLSRKPMFAGG